MARESLRYTIEAGGAHRKILSVALQPNGDLIVDLKPATDARPNPDRPWIADKIESARSTVHMSNRSLSGNQITNTRIFKSGTKERYVHFTEALKTYDQFAVLTARRYANLSLAWPRVSESGSHISLGRIDTSNFNLITLVFVSNRTRKFEQSSFDLNRINIMSNDIGSFKITILFNFLVAPSIDHGVSAVLFTKSPEKIEDEFEIVENAKFMTGVDERGAETFFLDMTQRFAMNYVKLTGAPFRGWSIGGTLDSSNQYWIGR